MAIKWEDIKGIADQNSEYLDEVPESFLNKDVTMSEEELLTLLLPLVDEFDVEDGKIKKTRKNLFKIVKVDQLFKDFAMGAGLVLVVKLIGKLQKVVSNNLKYFSKLLGKIPGLNKTKKDVVDLVNRRLGINKDGYMDKGGYLYDMNQMDQVRNDIREFFYKKVISEPKQSDLRNDLKKFVIGDKEKETRGIIHKFYSKFTSESFSQIDRMASVEFAAQHGLTKFIYYGNIIKTSRKFCITHIFKVYTVEEGMKWPYESPSPLGISTATYNPVIDMGGINCRHCPFFITDEMAEERKEFK